MISKQFLSSAVLAFMAIFSLPSGVFAQADYPSRPITLMIPFPPGGITDIVGREVALNLTKYLKQPVIVENRAGAAGSIGTLALAKTKPDGYTLGILTVSGISIAPHVTKSLGYDAVKDFTPITNVVRTDGAIVANVNAPFNTVKDFVQYAKDNPGKVSYASSGMGAANHLTAEMFAQRAGINLLHVPYKGTSPAMQDLLANHINLSFETSLAAAMNNISSGRLKVIAITGAKRADVLPNVPTVAESGYPNFSAQSWFGLFGPANLPPQILEIINKATTEALRDPAVMDRFEKLGVNPDPSSARDFVSFLQQEDRKWSGVAKAIKLELQ